VRRITLYHQNDGSWTLQPGAGNEVVEAELEDGYMAVQGRGGPPRILSTKSDELGMTFEQAVRRGVLHLLPREETRSDRPTLVDPRDDIRRVPK
jgi:hypothetical protein